mmetsp:Transcript_81618/g.243398  ORF Transcript_81618/g.243398 Transcript_81618/m.243398 type:complete len:423 (-) Transcript_81618:44-1312(-)
MAGRQEELDRCLERYEEAAKAYGKASPDLAKVEIALGHAYVDVGSIRQGLAHLETALGAEEAHLQEAPAVYAEAMECLAYVYGMLEERKKEGDAMGRASKLHELAGNTVAQAWISVLTADFRVRHNEGKLQVESLRKAAALLEGVAEGEALRKAALCLLAASPVGGRSKATPEEQAVGRYFHQLALAGRACGPRTSARGPALAAALLPLGEELADQKVTELQRLQKIVEALSKTHGADSVNAVQALVVLADAYGDQDEQTLRLETLKKVLHIQERTFGFDSIYVAWTLKGLAHVYGKLGESESRLDALRRALELQEEEFGSDHPQAATTRYYLEVAQAEARRRIDADLSRDLSELFGRAQPTNPKVNRFVGECVFPGGLGPVPRVPGRCVMPFQAESSGGGSCLWREGGIDVPFYYPAMPVA